MATVRGWNAQVASSLSIVGINWQLACPVNFKTLRTVVDIQDPFITYCKHRG